MESPEPDFAHLQETESEAAERLQAAFKRVRNPMLIVDDQRRCVAANSPACALLRIEPEEVPWRRIDDFTPADDRDRLEEQWETFLANGEIEGWYQLPLPTGKTLPVEFSATANVLPGRHLSVVMPRPGYAPAGTGEMPVQRRRMVRREGLVAGGLTGGEIARHLILSPETIKSHVQNAMTRLGAHTRAHAVAIALRTGQIDALTVISEQAGPDRGTDMDPPLGAPPAGVL